MLHMLHTDVAYVAYVPYEHPLNRGDSCVTTLPPLRYIDYIESIFRLIGLIRHINWLRGGGGVHTKRWVYIQLHTDYICITYGTYSYIQITYELHTAT